MKNKYLFMFAITAMLCAGLMAGLSAKVWAAPSVTVDVNGTLGSNDWYTSIPTFTVSATEPSGIKTYEYVVTQSSTEPTSGWKAGSTGTITVESDANYVWYRVADNAGGVTIGSAGPYKLDRNAPSVVVQGAVTSWRNINPNVTLSVTENKSGLRSLEYQVTSSTTEPTTGWMPYTGAFTMPEGVNHVWYRAIDNAGNVRIGYSTNSLDTVPPQATFTTTKLSGTQVRINVTATDDKSGIKNIKLPDNSVVTTATAMYTAPNAGVYTFMVTDNANNLYSFSVTLEDTTAPTVNASNQSYLWRNSSLPLTLTYTDPESGVKTQEYQITGTSVQPTEGWLPYTEPLLLPHGVYYVWYRTVDMVGNERIGSFGSYKIDTVFPTARVSDTNFDWRITAPTVEMFADDADSGVNTLQWAISTSTTTPTSWTTYNKPVPIPQGVNYLWYRVTDKAGNLTTNYAGPYQVDAVAPTASATQTPLAGWRVRIDVTATDALSGVKEIRLPDDSVVAGATASYTATASGSYSFVVTDKAGNTYTLNVPVSMAGAPTVTADNTNYGWKNASIAVNLTYAPAGNELTATQYQITNSVVPPTDGWLDYTGTITVSGEGQSYVWYRTVDATGSDVVGRFGPYLIDRTAPTATFTKTALTGTQVNIDVVASDSDSGVQSIKLPNGTVVNGSIASYVAPKFGSYSFVITDKAGNTTTTEVIVADMTPPTVTANNQGGAWVRSNISVTLTWTDAESGVKTKEYVVTQDTTQPETGWLPYSSAISISTEGVYYIWYHAVDNADNSIYGYFGPYMLDKTVPTATSTLTPTTGTSVRIDVTAGDSLSGVKQIELPNTMKTIVTGNTASYEGKQGSRYNFVVTDNAGNTYTYSVLIPDTTPPTFSVNSKDYSWRKSVFSLNISASDGESGVSSAAYQITQSTTEPKGGWTTLPVGTWVSIDREGENYLWYRVTDGGGNTILGYYGPYRLDRVAPTVSYTVTQISDSEHRIDVTATDATSGIKQIQHSSTVVMASTASFTVTQGGRYNIGIYDNAENYTLLTVELDLAPPSVKAANTDYSWRKSGFSLGLTYSDDVAVAVSQYQVTQSPIQPTSGWKTYSGTIPISTHGLTYVWYRAVDTSNKEVIGFFGPYRIDQVAPTLVATQSNLADGQLLIKVTASDVDSGIASITLPDGTVVTGAEASFVATTTGSYVFVATDNAGNTKSYTHTITGIDFTPPTVQADPASSNWSKEPLAVSLTYSDSQGSVVTQQYQVTDSTTPPTTSWLDYVGAVTIQGDRVYYLWYRAVDDSGNEAVGHFGPYRFDLLAPTASLTVDLTDEGVRVTVTGSDSGSGVASITLPDQSSVSGAVASYFFTSTSGVFVVIDAVGNRMVVTEAMIAVAVVEKLESMGKNLTYAQVTAAQKLVDAVADASERAALQARLEVVRQSVPNPAEVASDAVDAAKDALNPATRYEDAVAAVQEAQNKIAQVTDPAEKARLEQQLAPVIAVVNAEGTVRSAEAATDALRQSETNLTPQSVADANAQVNAAKREAQALPASEKKDQLLERVREMEKAVQVADATLSVREAEQLVNSLPLTQASIDTLTAKYNEASRKVKGLPEGEERTELQSRLDTVQISLLELIARVRLAEAEALIDAINNLWIRIDDAQLALNRADQAVAKVPAGDARTALNQRVQKAQQKIYLIRAQIKVNIAEGLLIQGDINAAWPYINLLPEGDDKTGLTARLLATEAVMAAVNAITKAETSYNSLVSTLMSTPLTDSANLARVQALHQTTLNDTNAAAELANALVVPSNSPLNSRAVDVKNRVATQNRILVTYERMFEEAQNNIQLGNGYDVSRARTILGGSVNTKTTFDAAIKARLGSTDGLTFSTTDTSLIVLSSSGSVTAVKTGVAKITIKNAKGSMTVYLVITQTR